MIIKSYFKKSVIIILISFVFFINLSCSSPIRKKEINAQSPHQAACEYYNKGVIHNKKSEYKKALKYLTEGLAIYPNDVEILKLRASIYVNLKQYNKATQDFNKALKISPDDDEIYHDQGFLLAIQKKYHEALTNYDTALNLDPNEAQTYLNRAYILKNNNNFLQACKDYLKWTPSSRPNHA